MTIEQTPEKAADLNSNIPVPTLVEVERIAAIQDPVIRNLQITQCYYELSAVFARRSGLSANWCTFATWVSKQAGQTIRREDLKRLLERRLSSAPMTVQVGVGPIPSALPGGASPSGIPQELILETDDFTPDEQVRRAAEAVHAAPFIERLPERYETPVAERGATLSVGQKQLLSFARALAFDPRILVLDEATSSVDTDTELLIRDALHVLMSGRTTIAIAHRLSTIQDMDKILVLHRGELREMGTHQQLLAQRGVYWRLYRLQYKDQERAPAEE